MDYVFITNPYIIPIFYHLFYFSHLFINIFTFPNPKIPFPPLIKGFQSSQGVWKHWFISSHFLTHFILFIVHLCFLNLKGIPKKSLDFNLITFLLVGSTLTLHYSNLKIRFEELSIFYILHKIEHSTTIFLRILVMWMSSLISPLGKVFFTSKWCSSQFTCAAIAMRILMDSSLTIGEHLIIVYPMLFNIASHH